MSPGTTCAGDAGKFSAQLLPDVKTQLPIRLNQVLDIELIGCRVVGKRLVISPVPLQHFRLVPRDGRFYVHEVRRMLGVAVRVLDFRNKKVGGTPTFGTLTREHLVRVWSAGPAGVWPSSGGVRVIGPVLAQAPGADP